MPPTFQAVQSRRGGGDVGSLPALAYEQRLRFEAGVVCSPQRFGFSMVHVEEDELDAQESRLAPGFFTVQC